MYIDVYLFYIKSYRFIQSSNDVYIQSYRNDVKEAAFCDAFSGPVGFGYPTIPESDAQGSAVGLHSSPYMLELLAADDVEVDRLPAHRRRLQLFPTLDKASGRFVALVGRQHQNELFESWLPNEELRSCISRLAFEVSWIPSGDPQIVAKGP